MRQIFIFPEFMPISELIFHFHKIHLMYFRLLFPIGGPEISNEQDNVVAQ